MPCRSSQNYISPIQGLSTSTQGYKWADMTQPGPPLVLNAYSRTPAQSEVKCALMGLGLSGSGSYGLSTWDFIVNAKWLQNNQLSFSLANQLVGWSQPPNNLFQGNLVRVPILGNFYWMTPLATIAIANEDTNFESVVTTPDADLVAALKSIASAGNGTVAAALTVAMVVGRLRNAGVPVSAWSDPKTNLFQPIDQLLTHDLQAQTAMTTTSRVDTVMASILRAWQPPQGPLSAQKFFQSPIPPINIYNHSITWTEQLLDAMPQMLSATVASNLGATYGD
jgi:hypothetical protein